MGKLREKLQEKRELIKKGSVFPALSYLATGYLVGFFVSTFFMAFLATTELTGAQAFSTVLRNAEKVVAFAVIALVLVGAIFDVIGKRISLKQGIITIIVSVLFFILVACSYLVIEGLL
jgi:hypothetical protein